MFIQTDRINIEQIVEELYDFSKPGAIAIKDVLTARGRIALYRGVMALKHSFKKAEPKVNNITQDFKYLYIEQVEEQLINTEFLLSVNQLKAEYGEIYRKIAQAAQFSSSEFSSLGFNWYKAGSNGISPHRDFETDSDLVSIFCIDGHARFCICSDYEKNNSVKLDSTPGNLILLRAARNKDEQKYRPMHYVETIISEKLTAIFRHETKSVQH